MKIFWIFLALASSLFGANYYVDFATGSDANNGTAKGTPWKHAPGMIGRTGSYSHAAGDVFYFKGGVTWDSTCWPWTIPNSGTFGNVDTFTTDKTWFTGGSYAQPIFDGGHNYTLNGIIHVVSKNYILFNDFNIVNVGTAGAADPNSSKGFAMSFDSCNHWTVQYFVTAHEGEVLIYANETSGSVATYVDWNILHCDVSHATALVWMTTAGTNYKIDSVNIKSNYLHDGSSQVCHDIHGDGLAHFFSSPNHVSNQTITNLDISGNKVDGNWTKVDSSTAGMSAFIFSEMFVTAKIYNNSFTVTPLVVSQIPVWLYVDAEAGMTVEWYNNTIDSSAISSSGIGIYCAVGTGATAIVKNNLIAKTQYAIANTSNAGTFIADYNVCNSTSGNMQYNGSFQSFATWISAGRDTHGTLGTLPTFVGAPSDLHLANGSVGIGSGVDLTGTIAATDQNGVVRFPPWDAGAFAHQSAINITATSATVGTVTIQ